MLIMQATMNLTEERHSTAIAPPESDQGYGHGYVRGYAAAIEAFDLMAGDSSITPGEALRRTDRHFLCRLYDWRYDPDAPEPPPFVADNHAAVESRAIAEHAAAGTGPEYRHGYMDGWEEAMDTFGMLLAGHEPATDATGTLESGLLTPFAKALAAMRDHLAQRLAPWHARADPEAARRPPVLHPRRHITA